MTGPPWCPSPAGADPSPSLQTLWDPEPSPSSSLCPLARAPFSGLPGAGSSSPRSALGGHLPGEACSGSPCVTPQQLPVTECSKACIAVCHYGIVAVSSVLPLREGRAPVGLRQPQNSRIRAISRECLLFIYWEFIKCTKHLLWARHRVLLLSHFNPSITHKNPPCELVAQPCLTDERQ